MAKYRDLLGTTPVGWWPAGVADDLNSLAQDPVKFMDPSAAENLLDDHDSTANVPHGHDPWYYAEGPMASNTQFCDMISDYWPDDWDFPVGYHVTVPCHQADTAYRSFLQAFGYDSDLQGNPILRYQHDTLRDVNTVDTHFGTGGLCRAGNLGQPMTKSNTMTYCTQQPLDQTEDYTIPDAGHPPQVTAWSNPACSPDSSKVPWPDHTQYTGPYDSALYSVGTVPNMPPPGTTTYPATMDAADNWNVGPTQEIVANHNTWGPLCSDYGLARCSSSAQCIQGYQCIGMRCQGNAAHTCSTSDDCPGDTECLSVCAAYIEALCLSHAGEFSPLDISQASHANT